MNTKIIIGNKQALTQAVPVWAFTVSYQRDALLRRVDLMGLEEIVVSPKYSRRRFWCHSWLRFWNKTLLPATAPQVCLIRYIVVLL